MRRNLRRITLFLIVFTLLLAGMMLPADGAGIMAEETMPKPPVSVAASFDGSDIVTTWDCITFGTNRGEPIKWLVLDVAENGDALLLSDAIELYQAAYPTYVDSNGTMCRRDGTWANSSIRETLNDNFLNYAFSESERADILPAHLVNEDNPDYGTDGGPDTDDKVFCLSVSEATNPKYGFSSVYKSETRIAMDTRSYSERRYQEYSSSGRLTNVVYSQIWYLRTPGKTGDRSGTPTYSISYVGGQNVSTSGHTLDSVHQFGIRPALGINLKNSKNWKYAGKETKGTTASPISLWSSDVTKSLKKDSYECTGKALKPPVTVEYGGTVLKEGTDYTVSYSDNVNVGTGRITLTGKGFFTGTTSCSFSITKPTKTANLFPKKSGKYYYSGYDLAPDKTYKLSGELVIDRELTIPVRAKITAQKITIKGGTSKRGMVLMESGSAMNSKNSLSIGGNIQLGYGSSIKADGNISVTGIVSQNYGAIVKCKKAVTIKSNAVYTLGQESKLTAGTSLSISGSAKFNMSGNATVDTAKFSYSSSKSGQITGGTIKASGDVTLGKKFNSTDTNVLRMDGSDKQKLTLPKGSKVICLSFEDRSLNKVSISGSGQVKKLIVDPKKLGLSEELKEDDYHKYFSISKVPAHDPGIDRAIETVLFLKLTDKKLAVNDLLKEFYSSMKGKAKFGSNKFNIPVIVKLKKGGYERGHIRCDGFSFNTIGAWDVVYESGSKKYKLAVTTSMFNNQKALDKFMKGLSKDGAEEIKSEVRDFIEGSLFAAFGEISDACSFEKGRFVVDLHDGSKMATDYWSLLTKMNRVNSKLK